MNDFGKAILTVEEFAKVVPPREQRAARVKVGCAGIKWLCEACGEDAEDGFIWSPYRLPSLFRNGMSTAVNATRRLMERYQSHHIRLKLVDAQPWPPYSTGKHTLLRKTISILRTGLISS
jgi:hypothetical protein